MKCYCGYNGKPVEAEVSGGGEYGAAIKTRQHGKIDLFICPECGLMFSDLRGTVGLNKDKVCQNNK